MVYALRALACGKLAKAAVSPVIGSVREVRADGAKADSASVCDTLPEILSARA